ncbi:MAG: tyrosine--tRNA ligase [Planctomycetia bacterium]|nr:tyrosine--tRNA ligase [Planctomycetia bacterium]
MSKPANVIADMTWRGLLNQITDQKIESFLLEKPRTLYTGFDPTADSLHIGHLVAIMNLRRFQKAGHRPIALLGGATGMIGDPSGKSEERKLLTVEMVQHNVDAIQKQMSRFIDFDEKENGALLLNNLDWVGKFSYLDFLREIGKHFPVNVMLTKDSVKSRLERTDSGLSYTEFSYMLLQSYDFVYLRRNYQCELQVGGSDQWGNITAGIDLARRMDGVELYGLTSKLLLKSDGTKMGKSESGAVWLDPERTSPYQFYQYWINVDDADIAKALRFFTDLDENDCNELLIEHQNDAGQRLAQRQIAQELTKLVHGETGLLVAEKATQIFFGAEINELNDAQLNSIFADVPSKEISKNALTENEGLPIIDALMLAGLATTKSDARRTIQQGGAYVNNKPINDINAKLTTDNLVSETIIVLRSGKKRYALLKTV